jgi:hypothetical protein
MRRIIKLSVIAALVTVLAHELHHPCDRDNASSPEEMGAYWGILQMLGTLAQKSSDARLATAKDLCMKLFTKLTASRKGEYRVGQTSASGPVSSAGTSASGAESEFTCRYLTKEMIFS